MMLNIQSKADPRIYWNIIKEGLHAILEKAPPDLDWGPADLLTLLMRGDAYLTLLFWDGAYAGFYVTRHLVEEFKRRPYLFLWLIYKVPTMPFQIEEAWPFIQDEAKKFRAKYVSGWSPRHGWGRKLATEWMTIFRRSV